jgi:hypothetical protein
MNKAQYTETLYNHLKHTLEPNTDVSKLYKRYWVTGRSTKNLRLTEEGKNAFDSLDLEFFEFHIDTKTERYNYDVMNIGKKLRTPFWVGFRTRFYKSAYIRIYDSKIAMLITLYGSLNEYLNSIKK